MTTTWKDRLFIASQYLAPQHTLSRLVGALAESEFGPVRNTFIRQFAARFNVDMSEAERESLGDYRNFNDFFTRALKADARPFPEIAEAFACPVDGAVSQIGRIEGERIFQAKGQSFNATELLGGDAQQARYYRNGQFATLYLSPRDYHRIHMPCNGKLLRTTFVPGRLFSVNTVTADHVPRLFARNERLVCEFETDHGRMIMVLVGAMIVASIETTWAGVVAPYQRQILQHHYDEPDLHLSRGEEMGRFRLGSTVILMLPDNSLAWSADLVSGAQVRLGQAMTR
ncbi:MAG: archaetidylserine decarboxylase [Saccharospirillum sp.]|nr:archaetidylserine decarboxylase [Saccharospirillum sp.]